MDWWNTIESATGTAGATTTIQFSSGEFKDLSHQFDILEMNGYVNLNGVRADRPTSVQPGQQYFSTSDNYPWFTDGVSSWFSATGSIVSAL